MITTAEQADIIIQYKRQDGQIVLAKHSDTDGWTSDDNIFGQWIRILAQESGSFVIYSPWPALTTARAICNKIGAEIIHAEEQHDEDLPGTIY